MNLKLLCTQVGQIIVQTGNFIKQQQNKINLENIERKGLHDFVTYVDKESEKRLVDFLRPLVQGAGFITEEKTVTESQKEYTWIIDPLDGTTNFIHGLAPYAISIALQRNNVTILGMIYEISQAELFYAYEGKPACLNDRPIEVSKVDKLENSLIATGFPINNFNRLPKFLNSMNHFMQHTHGLRRLGSAATALAYVACGRFEGFYEYNLNAWDVAAGAYIVEMAGGKVNDFSNSNNYIFGKEIVASNSNVFDEFFTQIKKYMQD